MFKLFRFLRYRFSCKRDINSYFGVPIASNKLRAYCASNGISLEE